MSSESKPSSADCEVTGEIELNWRNEIPSNLSELFKTRNPDEIRNIFNDIPNFNPNAALVTTGPLAGYTALHFACLNRNGPLVRKLIDNYRTDVNVIADDGAQPIHLSVIFHEQFIFRDLLRANADVDAEITRGMYLKHTKNEYWPNDFGNTMTLLSFALFTNSTFVATELIHNNADVTIRTIDNKTLLMYAIEKKAYKVSQYIIDEMKSNNSELIDARDNAGLHVFHYFLCYNKYKDYQLDHDQLYWPVDKMDALCSLIGADANIYAKVNEDPDTLIINIAAQRSYFMLNEILPYYNSIAQSKALRNATLPIGDPQKYFRTSYTYFYSLLKKEAENKRQLCMEVIIMDLINRRSFGLYVPKEEIEMMEHLIATDSNIRKFVDDYKKGFIEETLKKQIIRYGDISITLFEVARRCFDNKLLEIMVKDDELIKAVKSTNCNNYPHQKDFINVLIKRINKAKERSNLLEELKISQIGEAILLPYEIVLLITEYLNNQDLKKFIDAFYDMFKYFSWWQYNYIRRNN